jgi:hypothetical protein
MLSLSHPFRLSRVLLPALLVLAGCSDATGPDDAAALLEQSREIWFNAGIASYRYTITRSCECTPESAGPVTVEVKNGLVVDRRYESGAAVSPQYSEIFTTVPGLFDIIEEAVALPAASLSVRYHEDYGYPQSIAIDWVAGAVDDEVSYRVSDFTILR